MARRAVFAVMSVSFLLGVLFATLTPLWQTPDEPTHTAYIETIAYRHHFPQPTDQITPDIYDSLNKSGFWPEIVHSVRWPIEYGRTMSLTAAAHPPLYYTIGAPIFWAATPFGLAGQVYALRLFGVLMALLTVWLAYKTAALLFPDDSYIQVMTAILLGLQPMFLFIMAGVNNDALANPLFAATFYVLALFLMKGLSWRRAVALGVILGLGFAAKESFIIMVPVAFVVLAIRAFMSRDARQGARDLGLTALAAALSASWLLLWNYAAYSRLLGRAGGGGNAPSWSKFMSLAALRDYFFRKIGTQYWGEFGWLSISMSNRVYQALYVFCAIAAVGLVVWLVRAYRRRELSAPLTLTLLMLAGTTVGIVIAVMRFDILTGGGSQGRYLFTALVPISLFLAVGVRGLTPDRWRRYLLPAAAVGFSGLCILAMFGYVLPHFYLT
jgi:4-amino-4-deoxy-L-arabinose transferase-like glycosyltransferase